MIGEILFTLFIWPIQFILEFLFVLFNRIFSAPGLAIIFLSIVVNIFLLPIYLIADRWQKEDQDLQKKMKKKLDVIRSAFKGDEKQMIINAYYRQMGYSPVFMLKASVGLILQIPFFIAAYHFLSKTSMLSGVSFLFLTDLNTPDALLKLPFAIFGTDKVNIMPFIMTVINLLSAFIYAKNMGKREIIQLSVMAFVFLILLYSSPSGLVLYWTMNNIFSLVKNSTIKYIKNPQFILKIIAILTGIVFLIMIWTGKANVERYKIMFSMIAMLLIIVPFLWNKIKKMTELIKNENFTTDKDDLSDLYIWSFIILFLLIGFLNPAQVLSSSVYDFEKPWTFFLRTFLQGLSLLFLVPLFIRALSPIPVRRIFAGAASVLALNSLLCFFALSAYYGVMDRNFTFENTERLRHAFPLWISIIVPLAAIIVTTVLIIFKKEKILGFFYKISCIALIVLGIVNLVTMHKQYTQFTSLNNKSNENTFTVFPLSKTQRNVFIIFLDRAQGSAMLDALDFIPSFKKELDGFIFYPNSLSFGSATVTGVPALFGGYKYTPSAINERKDELLVNKVNEALKLIPEMFSDAGFRVTFTDPVIANMQSVPDISIFENMENVNARLLTGKLTDRFRADFPNDQNKGASDFDFDILFRYGIFRTAPPVLRYGIYYKGLWWREAAYNSYGRAAAEFSSLYYLPQITYTDEGSPALNILSNGTVHEAGAYNTNFFPQSKPVIFSDEEIERYGSKENTEYMYVFFAAIKQLVKWFQFLKNEEVYDNTRIIVVSDHGGRYTLSADTADMKGYNPLFMVKDFDSRGEIIVSNEFMTHSDTPYFAAENIIDDMGISKANEEKSKVLTVFSLVSSQTLRHGPYLFNFISKRELKGREVLKKESWSEWEKY